MTTNPGFSHEHQQDKEGNTYPHTGDAELTPWSSGATVKQLQELLNAHGYNLRVDGDFGYITEAAVKAFQKQGGLRIDGIVKAEMWQALKSSVQPGSRTLQRGCTGNDVYELQGLLQVNGYNVYRNGKFDMATQRAVIAFQQHHQLHVTGIVERTTWILLMGHPSLPAPPKQTGWWINLRRWW